MKVLTISSDPKINDPESAVAKRIALQRAQVEELGVLSRAPGESKIKAAIRMVREGKKGQWDIVLTQDPFWLGAIGVRIAKAIGAKVQIQVHTDLAEQPLWKRLFARIQLRRANSVRVVSERIKKSLEPLELKAPIVVLPIFIDKEVVRAAPPIDVKQIFPQFEKTILVASRLEPEKDVALAIRHIPTILKTFPKAGLLIAGEGSQLQALQLLAEKLSVSNSVIFLGHRSDIFSLYKSMDVLLNTSRYEGFGASIVEALAAGCPVVSTDVGVAREAGAVIASKKEIGQKVVEVLQRGERGELKLILPPAFEWAQLWKDSLKNSM